MIPFTESELKQIMLARREGDEPWRDYQTQRLAYTALEYLARLNTLEADLAARSIIDISRTSTPPPPEETT